MCFPLLPSAGGEHRPPWGRAITLQILAHGAQDDRDNMQWFLRRCVREGKVCTDELVSISDSEHAARVTRLEAEIAKRDGWIHSQQGRAQKRRAAYDNKIAMLEAGVAQRDEALQHARVQESCLRAPVRSSADSVVAIKQSPR